MFDVTRSAFSLTNAVIVSPDGVYHGGLSVDEGVIQELEPERGALDFGGDFLVPGAVDLHTDHVETHLHPRSGVTWSFRDALIAHDAVVISGGTTTVFDSLCVGASLRRPERRQLLAPLIAALEEGARDGLYRAEHLLHLRCEVSDPKTPELIHRVLGGPLVKIASIMDHTPGDRQCVDIDDWTQRLANDLGLSQAEAVARREELVARSAEFGDQVRADIASALKIRGLPFMTHDDRTPEHVAQSAREGAALSEFPTTLEAAQAARDAGQTIVAGAPNYLRGGSQSGNVSVKALLQAGLVDVLASDYVPHAPMTAAFAIAEDASLSVSLEDAIAMVTETPARAAGLTDRGCIAPGYRADFVRLRRENGKSQIIGVWRAGVRVF